MSIIKSRGRHKKGINNLVKKLSRSIVVYKDTKKSECPNCYYDKLTDRSTGKCKWTLLETLNEKTDRTKYKYFVKGRCPICHGRGYLETKIKVNVDCLVNWVPQEKYDDKIMNVDAGSFSETIVRLKTEPKHLELFKHCSHIVVDGIRCVLSKPPFLRGVGSQSLLIVVAYTDDKLDRTNSEIVKDYK